VAQVTTGNLRDSNSLESSPVSQWNSELGQHYYVIHLKPQWKRIEHVRQGSSAAFKYKGQMGTTASAPQSLESCLERTLQRGIRGAVERNAELTSSSSVPRLEGPRRLASVFECSWFLSNTSSRKCIAMKCPDT